VLPCSVALRVQRASRIATNTDHIHPRVARSERVKRRKGQCQRPHQIIYFHHSHPRTPP
jgi:hypothetical protein